MENKIYARLFNRFLSNSETLDSVEKTTILSIKTMIVIYSMIHVFFAFFFSINYVPQMLFVNITSILICILNLYCLSDTRKLAIGLIMWTVNSCYYILATVYILGYDKNSIIFIPVLLLLIHIIYPKKKKYLIVNTIIVLLTYFTCIFLKFNIDSKYYDDFDFIEIVNTSCALVLSALIIYLKSTIDELVNANNLEQLDDLAEEVDALTTEANIDFLTGLWNRRYMEQQLEIQEFTDAYLIVADIDYFKRVNDRYGHLCGDYVLKEVSHLFSTTFRNIDIVSRWGGEEFLIFVKSSNQKAVIDRLDATRKIIEETTYEYNDITFNITVTFGISYVDKSISIKENVERADDALYFGKNNGRNCIISYDDMKDSIE